MIEAAAPKAILSIKGLIISVRVKNTAGMLKRIISIALRCKKLDASFIIGFLWDARFVRMEATKKAICTKNMILKLLAKSSENPIAYTLTEALPLS